MKPSLTRNVVRRMAAAGLVVAVIAGCDGDGLDPDVTVEQDEDMPPATDTRTTDPPVTLPPVTEP